jgi:hypothetical protein
MYEDTTLGKRSEDVSLCIVQNGPTIVRTHKVNVYHCLRAKFNELAPTITV